MASTDIWFAFYIGDYMADTMHLSTMEHGAYFLILAAYYKNRGPLPDDDAKMSRIARMSLSDWSAIRTTIASFFDVKDGVWIQKRADFEIKRSDSTQAARRKGAAITNAKLGRTASDTLSETVSERSAIRSEVGIPQSQSQSQPQSKSKAQKDVGELPLPGTPLKLESEVKKSLTDEEWISSLKQSKAYESLDVDQQYAKMQQWCRVNGKSPSRRRFINWLNRCERPMTPIPPKEGGNF